MRPGEPQPPLTGQQLEVGRLVGGRLHPPELLRGEALDAGRRGVARELRRQLRVLRAQVGALAAEAVELHVQAQDGDVGRDDACEQRGDHCDPEHAAGDPALTGNGARPGACRDNSLLGPGCGGPGGHQTRIPTRSRADEERGFAAFSRALGRIALREVARSSGCLPQTQIGKSGGHSQPRSRSRMKRLTSRSSSEWKLITASLPPGRSMEKAEGSAASSDPSSSLTAMRKAWNTRFAGCPSPNLAGAGMAVLIVSTRSLVRSKGCSFRRRTIAFAIWRAYRSSPERLKIGARSRSS